MTTTTATATIVRQPLHSLCLFSPPADEGISEAPGSKHSHYRHQHDSQQQYDRAHEQVIHSRTPALSTTATTTTASIASTPSTASSSDSSKRSSYHHQQQQQTIDSLESWPMAVEALAQRLWDCGRDAFGRHYPSSLSPSSSSFVLPSKLVFDDDEDKDENGNGANNYSSSSPNSVICDAPICQDDVAADSLCDGPYVKIDYAQPELGPTTVTATAVAAAAACSPPANYSAAAVTEKAAIRQQLGADDHGDDHIPSHAQSPTHQKQKWQHQQQQQLCQNQPMTNPFKTMMLRQLPPSCTAVGLPHHESPAGVSVHQRPGYMRTPYRTAAPTPRAAATPALQNSACVHCKRGNFLEFCFVNDRCRCACHAECPCKPCIDIREQRLNQKASFTIISAAAAHASAVSTPTKRSHNDYFVKHHSPHAAKAARVWNGSSQKQQQQQQQPQQHGLCSLAS